MHFAHNSIWNHTAAYTFTPSTRNPSIKDAFAKARFLAGPLRAMKLWTVFGLVCNAPHKNQRTERVASCSYHKQKSPKPRVSVSLWHRTNFNWSRLLTPVELCARYEFCREMLARTENDDDLTARFILGDEATFHINDKVNRHNVRVWGDKNSSCHPWTRMGVNKPECVLYHFKGGLWPLLSGWGEHRHV
jgi:hypothetical protein